MYNSLTKTQTEWHIPLNENFAMLEDKGLLTADITYDAGANRYDVVIRNIPEEVTAGLPVTLPDMFGIIGRMPNAFAEGAVFRLGVTDFTPQNANFASGDAVTIVFDLLVNNCFFANGGSGGSGGGGSVWFTTTERGNVTQTAGQLAGFMAVGDYILNDHAESLTLAGAERIPGAIVQRTGIGATNSDFTKRGNIRGGDGAPGTQGTQGTPGTQGTRGSRIFTHTAAQTATQLNTLLPNVGDFSLYMGTTNVTINGVASRTPGTMFERTATGSAASAFTERGSIRGAQGPAPSNAQIQAAILALPSI